MLQLPEVQGPFVVDGGQFTYSAIGNLLITSQDGELSVLAMKKAGDLHANVLARYPRGTCMISHLSTMKVPSSEVRTAIAESMDRFSQTTLKRAIILSDDGFVASIVRSVLGGMASMDRSYTTQRYFSNITEAAGFLTDVVVPSSIGAAAVLAAARATIDAHGQEMRPVVSLG